MEFTARSDSSRMRRKAGAGRIAREIYPALKNNRDALVQGSPGEGECTLIDGTFDLRKIARKVLPTIIDRADGVYDRIRRMVYRMPLALA
jgi:hypothetical protein